MSLVYHERPGVYSSYDASSIIARGSTERVIALIGKAEAKAGLYRLHSYAEAKEAFAEGSELGRMAKLAYQNGAGTVLASPVAEDTLEAYQAEISSGLVSFEEVKAMPPKRRLASAWWEVRWRRCRRRCATRWSLPPNKMANASALWVWQSRHSRI